MFDRVVGLNSDNGYRCCCLVLSCHNKLRITFALIALGFAGIQATADNNNVESRNSTRQVVVTDLKFQTHVGSFRSMTNEQLVLEIGEQQTFSITGVYKIEWLDETDAFKQPVSFIQLVNGDRLTGYPAGVDDEYLTVVWPNHRRWTNWKIPLENVHSFVFVVPNSRSEKSQLWRTLSTWDEDADLVVLKNGDRIQGVIERINRSTLFVEQTEVLLSGVQAVAINPLLLSELPTNGPHVRVALKDGSQFTAKLKSWSKAGEPNEGESKKKSAELETLWGQAVSIPETELSSVRFLGRRPIELSELQPVAYQHAPYLSQKRMWSKNQNVMGGPFQVGEKRFGSGVGMYSKSRLTFGLDGKYSLFQTGVGIDVVGGSNGNVVVSIEADGEKIAESVQVTADDKLMNIGPLNVIGKKRLSLVVEYGKNGDIGDCVDWCEPTLILADPDTMN